MLRILHISDLHFGPPFIPAAAEALLQVVPEIDPHLIVASGDFTQRAKRQQFVDARSFLDRLVEFPIVVVPGNHDVPLYRVAERIFDPHGLYREIISEDLDRVWELETANVVGLNSTAPHRTITTGRLSKSQLDFCAKACAAAEGGAARIVVAHHPLVSPPDSDRDVSMPGAQQAVAQFVEMGVDLVLGGHLHQAYSADSREVFPSISTETGVVFSQSGTTTSRRGRGHEAERNSFNVVEINSDSIQVRHYDYGPNSIGFQPVGERVFAR